jgi:hypothetical protein
MAPVVQKRATAEVDSSVGLRLFGRTRSVDLTTGLISGRVHLMARTMTMDEREAKMLARECPDRLIEIVKTYKLRSNAVAVPPQFILNHGDGRWSVAELKERP